MDLKEVPSDPDSNEYISKFYYIHKESEIQALDIWSFFRYDNGKSLCFLLKNSSYPL